MARLTVYENAMGTLTVCEIEPAAYTARASVPRNTPQGHPRHRLVHRTHLFGIVQDNPSSAEAIMASREDICICAQDLNDSNGQSLRNVALMAMACAENTSVDGLSDNQRTVMAKFMKPSMPSVVTQATAAESITRSAPWFAQSDEFLRMVGFDEPTIQTLRKFRTLDSANNLLSMFNATQAAPVAVS